MRVLANQPNRVARLLIRRQLRRSLLGRRLDPNDEARGRLTRRDIDEIANSAVRNFQALITVADLDKLDRAGNRLNTRLAVLTVAVYRGLLDAGVPRAHAGELLADAGWRIYQVATRPLIVAARARTADRQRRVNTALRWLLRFPFAAPGRPGYEVEVWEEIDALHTTWTWCPPQAFVRQVVEEHGDRGELAAFAASWCSYDWALNDLLAGGEGSYSRPNTMSLGDACCAMRWSATPGGAQSVEIRSPTAVSVPKPRVRSQLLDGLG